MSKACQDHKESSRTVWTNRETLLQDKNKWTRDVAQWLSSRLEESPVINQSAVPALTPYPQHIQKTKG